MTAKMLQEKKKACLLLKIDIARAFHLVAWVFLLEVLQHMEFTGVWREWISVLLSMASTKVLLNGNPVIEFVMCVDSAKATRCGLCSFSL
jgi:hypothetical protein